MSVKSTVAVFFPLEEILSLAAVELAAVDYFERWL